MLSDAGWFHIRGQSTYYYRSKDEGEKEVWPPKYWKFAIQTAESPTVEAAFTDSRRFARIRLVDCAAEAIRQTTPLKENGPDPVLDKDILTVEWLEQILKKKHVPIKALLLDQANISGIGNWVGDEILYNSKLHPEQYSDTFNSAQIKKLHESMMYICQTAVDLLADSTKFPDDWLFKHRWGKGKKDAPAKLPSGEAITFLTVGGRTSCVVPSVQKKTGATAGDVKRETSVDSDAKDDEVTEEPKAKPTRKRKAVAKTDPEDEVAVPKKSRTSKKPAAPKKSASEAVETTSEEGESKPAPRPKKEGSKSAGKVSKSLKAETIKEELPRRRSQRQSKVNESRD
ncbi:hypothetical protein CJF32_00007499 [Rutstroemia sp. NJR-2017a WRK4]|nr:hypothetical protein CJF32_00007499 [Rutstroemia sp. NJR-2017a WRK4]